MYELEIKEIYTDKKYCLCGCGQVLNEEHWGIRVDIKGSLESYEECLEIVEKFETSVNKLAEKDIVCKYCGKCCLNGPEIEDIEKEYLFKNFPENIDMYNKIISGKECPAGGLNKTPCVLPLKARPLQCRLLFCETNIVGFEKLYNFLGDYLNWEKV